MAGDNFAEQDKTTRKSTSIFRSRHIRRMCNFTTNKRLYIAYVISSVTKKTVMNIKNFKSDKSIIELSSTQEFH